MASMAILTPEQRAQCEEMVMRNIIRRIEASRESFWEFEKTLYPQYFKESIPYLKKLASQLEDFYEDKIISPQTGLPYRKLIINIPPQHYKTFTLTNFNQWVLGRDPDSAIINVSYNETMSSRYSKAVRDGINCKKIDKWRIIYSDIFPDSQIKSGDAAYQMWSLRGRHISFLATSFLATMTGVGCKLGIIDDPIRSNKEAMNENTLESHVDWYLNTYRSRLQEGAKQIINMTRWATKDLCGYMLKNEPGEWYVICFKIRDEETGEMLAPDVLSFADYLEKIKGVDPAIVRANYFQEPIDIEGRLYKYFQEYDQTQKVTYETRVAYCDTADEGDCFLNCNIAGIKNGYANILDVYYTQDGQEITETETARRLHEFGVQVAVIESNNGGRAFARNVQRILREKFKNITCHVQWFHQSDNKDARIKAYSSAVMDYIRYPKDWQTRWPAYYDSMSLYQAQGKNKYNDAEDGTTGIAEILDGKFSIGINHKIVRSKAQLGIAI